MLNNLQRYQEALDAFDQAIQLEPNNASFYHNKSAALQNLGRRSEAERAYQKARELGLRE